MKRGLKLIFVSLPLMLIGAAVLVYVVSNRPAPERIPLSERATAVRVITTKTQLVVPQVIGFGIVQPERNYDAVAQVAGIAEYVNPSLQKGAILPAGAVLLRLSPADFNLNIAQAKANIRAAEAHLAELDVSAANLASALKIEQEAVELKADDLERIEALFAGGTATKSSLNTAQGAYLAQRQKVVNLENSIALLPTQKAVQKEQISVYQSSLDTATLNLERTELKLPFAARVSEVSVEIGQFVGVGQVTARLDGINAAEVEAQISVANMATLFRSAVTASENMPLDPVAMVDMLAGMDLAANVRLQLGESVLDWPASVVRISDTIDQKTGTLGVIVRVENAYRSATPGLRPPLTKGMFVEVTLSAQPLEGQVIPRGALHNGQVFLVDSDDRLELVSVSPDLVQGDIALIGDGLEAGRRVVVSVPSPVIAGMLLEITEDVDLMTRLSGAGNSDIGQPE